MKKVLGGGILIVASVLILILAFVPGRVASASEDEKAENVMTFEMEGGILRKYNGNDAEIEIPGGVTEIGPQCFKDSSIESITIPGTVKKIDEMAFYGCNELQYANIDEGTVSIGASAFANCESLWSVSIPSTVTKISPGTFSSDPMLSDVYVDGANESYICEDGVLYNYDKSKLVQYLAGREDSSYEIPASVKKINKYAFFGAENLTDVSVSAEIGEIPDRAFSYCAGLTNIFVPASVKRIGEYAFSDCINLKYLALEGSNVKIADTAFANCSPDFKYDQGVSAPKTKKTSKSAKKTADKSVSSDQISEGDETDSDSDDDDAGAQYSDDNMDSDASDIDAVTGTDASMNIKGGKSVKSSSIPIVNIDTSDPDLVGASKVSGGNALIIPEEK